MKVYSSVHIRNVGFMSHVNAGKTSLTEALAYNTGATKRLGKVDEGNTIADYHSEEIARKVTVNTSLVACEWQNTKINILDTPGLSDFFGEVKSVLRVADSLVILLDAVAGVEVRTEIIWDLADIDNTPRFAFINKMDRENANFYNTVSSMQENLTKQIIPIQLPIGSADQFKGIVDLLNMRAYHYDGRGKPTTIAIPEEMLDEVNNYREKLIEAAVESDDELTMKYLEGEELSTGEITRGLKLGILNCSIVPILCGSALLNIGCDLLLDVLVDYAPNPLERIDDSQIASKESASLIFKTIADPYVGRISYFKVLQGVFHGDSFYRNANKSTDEKVGQLFTMQGKIQMQIPELHFGDIGAIAKLAQTSTGDTLTTKDSNVIFSGINYPIPTLTIAIEPKTKVDEDKLGNAINRILEEDPTLRLETNLETKQTLLTGLGEAHIDIIIEKLKNKFGVEVEKYPPKVPYRETIRGIAKRIEAKHKKQSGGAGQYGHVFIDISPYPDGELEFDQKVFGGAVPKQYFPAVEKGVREAMSRGIIAGYPVTNVKVTLVDGSYHSVDSNEMAFKMAGIQAFKKGFKEAQPVILEPFNNIEIEIPEEYMGDIIGDLNSKRGRILGMEPKGKYQVVKAQAPLSEMHSYTIDLKSLAHGRGSFNMEFSHYEELPINLAEKIITETKAE